MVANAENLESAVVLPVTPNLCVLHHVTSHAIMEESVFVTTRVNVNEDILEMIVLNLYAEKDAKMAGNVFLRINVHVLRDFVEEDVIKLYVDQNVSMDPVFFLIHVNVIEVTLVKNVKILNARGLVKMEDPVLVLTNANVNKDILENGVILVVVNSLA